MLDAPCHAACRSRSGGEAGRREERLHACEAKDEEEEHGAAADGHGVLSFVWCCVVRVWMVWVGCHVQDTGGPASHHTHHTRCPLQQQPGGQASTLDPRLPFAHPRSSSSSASTTTTTTTRSSRSSAFHPSLHSSSHPITHPPHPSIHPSRSTTQDALASPRPHPPMSAAAARP